MKNNKDNKDKTEQIPKDDKKQDKPIIKGDIDEFIFGKENIIKHSER